MVSETIRENKKKAWLVKKQKADAYVSFINRASEAYFAFIIMTVKALLGGDLKDTQPNIVDKLMKFTFEGKECWELVHYGAKAVGAHYTDRNNSVYEDYNIERGFVKAQKHLAKLGYGLLDCCDPKKSIKNKFIHVYFPFKSQSGAYYMNKFMKLATEKDIWHGLNKLPSGTVLNLPNSLPAKVDLTKLSVKVDATPAEAKLKTVSPMTPVQESPAAPIAVASEMGLPKLDPTPAVLPALVI
jgi:hypothetical protein